MNGNKLRPQWWIKSTTLKVMTKRMNRGKLGHQSINKQAHIENNASESYQFPISKIWRPEANVRFNTVFAKIKSVSRAEYNWSHCDWK